MHCLLDDDRCLTVSDLYREIAAQYTYVNANETSIYRILTNELLLMKRVFVQLTHFQKKWTVRRITLD